MIEKLYNLKKTQTDQKIMEKGQILSKIHNLEAEIMLTQNNINSARLDKFGAISDFTILTMHKNTMKLHISKLEKEIAALKVQLEQLVLIIVEFQKETEQFKYLLDEQRNEAIKNMLLAEQEAADEYIQSKFINSQG
jgi:flagellar biosynthesis chaperone FliJ